MSFLEDDLTIEFSFISRSLAPSSGRDLESLLYSLDQRPQNVGNQWAVEPNGKFLLLAEHKDFVLE